MLAAHSSCLETELTSEILEFLFVFSMTSDVRELTQNGLSLSSSHVCGTCCDDSVSWMLCELQSALLDFGEQLVK